MIVIWLIIQKKVFTKNLLVIMEITTVTGIKSVEVNSLNL